MEHTKYAVVAEASEEFCHIVDKTSVDSPTMTLCHARPGPLTFVGDGRQFCPECLKIAKEKNIQP